MPKTWSLIVLALLILAGCGTSDSGRRHWEPNGTPRDENWHSPGLLLLRYDSNYDGMVTRAELEAGLRQDFWQADTNRDGCLDPNEVQVYNMRQIRLNQSTAIPLIDWNHDGCIDLNEFAAPMRSLFEEFDVDGDGKVTMAQMHLKFVKPPAATP